ncbi:LacI family DNA-binding transcriptional regulator [Arthrobacter sp. JZ12]|uniref:LacI family DNA-binding transcriptional regulator n=1 Tax=Arthrobacter sp. JZ12 TaxID=2654190 RepID=UPI002B47C60C|nr:LacI family DNA-binding transcriptional regulator [Arthrobacter sp. JZ12]WRH24195.1 LacI family DNA-binding transcriptional regulator [Arthrobacter sp. JZ12]
MATMQDVARLANVSIATVSFTINNTKPVAPATRARVEAAMQELGFRRNIVGRALAGKKTRIIALLFPALQHSFSGTVVEFFTSGAAAAREQGYNLVLWPISNDAGHTTELTSSGLVDGVILMEVPLDDPRVEELLVSGTPFTLIGRTRDPRALTYVDINFEETLVAAVRHLTALGHQRITLLDDAVGSRGLDAFGPVRRSRASYEAEMRRQGLEPSAFTCGAVPAAGKEAAGVLLRDFPDTTAVIIQNELAATGFVNGLRHAGVEIPGDLSVLSVGSSAEMAAMADPELTVLSSPSTELGRMGVEALIDQLEGRASELRQELVMCRLEGGQSTGPAPR